MVINNHMCYCPQKLLRDYAPRKTHITKQNLTQSMIRCGTGIHESLCYDGKAGIHYIGLVDIEYKIWILD